MIAQLPIEFEKTLREKYEEQMHELNASASKRVEDASSNTRSQIEQALAKFESEILGEARSQKEKQIAKAQAEKQQNVETKKKELVMQILALVEQRLIAEKSMKTLNAMVALLPKKETIQVWKGAKIPGTKAVLDEFMAKSTSGVAEYEATPKVLLNEKRDELIAGILEELND